MAVTARTMEGVDLTSWKDKHVLVTGHTGFKGSWLTLWLLHLGARVTGYALAPDTRPALFEQLDLASEINHIVSDLRDAEKVTQVIQDAQPDVVFHLAAQSLVLPSYHDPVMTWQVNTMGTIHVLEGLRTLSEPCAAVLITTDKVYENIGTCQDFGESDPLGGHDPYSSSKAGAELAISSWRRSFLQGGHPVRVASARAGNVIGGGDWAENRIVPDLVRALTKNQKLQVRNPNAIRPWQHVLEPLYGYIVLAEKITESTDPKYQDSFNFGPPPEGQRSVRELVDTALKYWPGAWQDASDADAVHEAAHLTLQIDRAQKRLDWSPRWTFEQTIQETISWYLDGVDASPSALRDQCLRSITRYVEPE